MRLVTDHCAPTSGIGMTRSADRAQTRLATRLSFFTAGFSMACWAPLVPFAKARIGVDNGTFGLLLLCLGIGSIGAMPLTGWLAARVGSKPMILGGGFGLVLLLPMLSVVDSAFVLALALLGFGASLGTIDVAMNVHAVEVERAAGHPLMSGFHAMFSVGGFAGAGSMILLLSAGAPPYAGALCGSALALAALGVAWPRLLQARGAPVPLLAPRGIVLLLAGLGAVTFLVEGAILDWSALLVIAAGLVGAAQGGLGYMLFAIAMTIGRLTGDRFVAKVGNVHVLIWGGLTAVSGFVLLLTIPFPPVALAGFLLIGFGASNLVPVLFSLAGRQTVMPAGLAVAALTTTGYAGILAGPAGMGFLSQAIGLHAAFWLLAGLMALVPISVAVLKLLASQAAISLENASLYRDLAEREARIRRLVDANIIGIFIWDFEGNILEANDAFLRMVGYDREDLASGRLRWTDQTPAEWRDRIPRELADVKMTGGFQPFEKEYFRKGGSRAPVLIGGALFDEPSDQRVAFVRDLTERKRAEAELRESEQRYREAQWALAHANRVATMGQLTASIAHEVNQPIATARNNAAAALRFLSRNSPDLEEAREALGCVVNDTDRASDIVNRIRALVKKVPPRNAHFDINDAINELTALARSELVDKGVTVQIRLAEGLSPVQGDRVQLQQVVLNLILNAVEAMTSVADAARELSVSTEARGADEVLVAVRDSGPGIDPEHLERIFDSFYTTKLSGMGLGLSICRSIIDMHGGRLWADANEPKGAVFQFTLPAANKDS
jgi:PAS domain S-box-containing protein